MGKWINSRNSLVGVDSGLNVADVENLNENKETTTDAQKNKVSRLAKVTEIPKATLNRYVIKVKEFGLENVNFNPGSDHLKIFTMEQEILLANYIKHACLIHFELSTKASRRLAFEFANANNVAIPDGWKSNKMAGKDWLYSFMTRHTLSLRTPEQTSLIAKPKLIVMDNHESHLSTEALDFAKENGIILPTLPPHCSHKLQTLDVAAFRSFKKFYNAACDTWMINNPGKPITIYSIAVLPFNSDIFIEEDFLSALVTDRLASPHQPIASTSRNLDEVLSSPGLPFVVDAVVSPEEIRPHPKAPSRKGERNIKKKRSAILTDTPTKKALEEEAAKRNDKKNQKVVAKKRSITNMNKESVSPWGWIPSLNDNELLQSVDYILEKLLLGNSENTDVEDTTPVSCSVQLDNLFECGTVTAADINNAEALLQENVLEEVTTANSTESDNYEL
ncbi:hypothetical protein ILUMI_18355 [Ignelater luminosus]|uniref:DDE-1 domain-containing protein n=1 Tax=Ignelater luminosus TaxID=2038154 RepID=A0A8K0G6Z3_IGNLU|nr:hypothetical protein ILUMI_18355 [Ignelater luminosus]